MSVRIGISGWTYAPWRGTFFPRELRRREELSYAAHQVASIEINGTFYSLHKASSWASWYERTPKDFVFSVKAPRFVTHIHRLKNAAVPMANFFASGVLCLQEKLGPILWQIPPSLAYDAAVFEEFLGLLPHDTTAALALARQHDDSVSDPWLKAGRPRRLRHALEVRHRSFVNREFIALLRRQGVALVIADTAGKWPFMEDITADFVYVRLHGDEVLYTSGYTDAALHQWAAKIRAWQAGGNPRGAKLTVKAGPPRKAGRDVFVYFDNNLKVRAPYDAMALAHLLGEGPKPAEPPPLASIEEKARLRWPTLSPRRARSKKTITQTLLPGLD
ncbi:MAG TPA: DUF72 domain-containing protein [Opitutaceae bacterium]|nr:DUF72 domain-containing protein [Opitutaceae bacterium]